MLELKFSVTFWGVRGGYPKPGPTTAHFGGNTTCIEIRAGYHLIIIDAGTGIIGLGDKLITQHQADGQPIVATILFTHTHHDHTQGFPFFAPARLGSSMLYIFGPKAFHEDLESVLARAMLPPVFPISLDELRSMRSIRNVSETEMIAFGTADASPRACNVYRERAECDPAEVRIRVMRSYAHPQGVFVYRIEMGDKSLVFATDVEGYAGSDRHLIRFARGTDLLIHDAEYTTEEYLDDRTGKQGWGHSTCEMAIEVARAAEAKKLALTHHSAHHDDAFLKNMEQQAQALFPATVMAREGLTLEI